METYIISKAYHWTKSNEIEIKSKNLIYSQIGEMHHGLQANSIINHLEILMKCKQVAELIKEIDKMNQ
jgi:hypothetical protein